MGYLATKQPCIVCESSDAMTIGDENGWICFSCGQTGSHDTIKAHPRYDELYSRFFDGSDSSSRKHSSKGPTLPLHPRDPDNIIAIPSRKLTRATLERYKYLTLPNGDEVASFCNADGRVVAQKVRKKVVEGAKKDFYWIGDKAQVELLYGQQLWRGKGGRRVVVVEGEHDAHSVTEAQGAHKWPVVSLIDGTDVAGKGPRAELGRAIEWLLTHDSIVLCFDDDDPGQAGMEACLSLFPQGRVLIAKTPAPFNDANDMLKAGQSKELIDMLWDARPWRPKGIFSVKDLLPHILEKPPEGMSYPWECMTRSTHGQRPGEIVLHCAGTGVGKSQIVKEIAAYNRAKHGSKIGIISLEETVEHALLCQIGIHMDVPLHVPEMWEKHGVTPKQVEDAGLEIAGQDDSGFQFFGLNLEEKSIDSTIRFLSLHLGVDTIILDHVSMVIGVSATTGNQTARLDEIMYGLRGVTRELNLNSHVVSHLRKKDSNQKSHEEGGRVTLDDLRNSGALKQVPNIIWGYERNQQDSDADLRDTTIVRLLKNRFTGPTGVKGALKYVPETGRIVETELPSEEKAFPPARKKSNGVVVGEV